MEQIILTCDWCVAAKTGRPDGLAFAVSTLVLQNGKPRAKSPKLDLCAKHVREIERVFRPRVRTGRPPSWQRRAATPEVRDVRATRHDALWQRREEQVVAALKDGDLKGPELVKKAKLSKHFVYKVTTRLLAAKVIERVGPAGARQGFRLTA